MRTSPVIPKGRFWNRSRAPVVDSAQCDPSTEDLAACETGACNDSDGDGECDDTDLCPGTTGSPVDLAGCDLEQFCDSFNPIDGHVPCRTADFLNNGQRECTTVRQEPALPVVYLCMPK